MLSKTIFALRKKRNWTQAELSEKSNIAQSMIAGYENGNNPSQKNLQKLATAFDIPVEKLLQESTSLDHDIEEPEFSRVIKKAKALPHEYQRMIIVFASVLIRENDYKEERDKLEQMLLKKKS